MMDRDFEMRGIEHIKNGNDDIAYFKLMDEFRLAKNHYESLDWRTREGRDAFTVANNIAVKLIPLQHRWVSRNLDKLFAAKPNSVSST